VSWGAILGAALWVGASFGVSVYMRQVVRYEAAYGVAGAVLALMIWLYLLSYAVLIGAALNAETERQNARDTTAGRDRPRGSRGASMADRQGG
jgi:membrane protein